MRDPWFPLLLARPSASLRLFCFPFAGGGASLYRLWPEHLPDGVEVRAVQPPGRETRIRERPFSSMEALVAALVPVVEPLLDRPHALFGHSLGALVAFELSRALAARGAPPPVRLFASGSGAPHLPRSRSPRAQLPDAEFEREVLAIGGTPPAVLAHPELMEVLRPALRADFRVSEGYRAPAGARVACPLTVFRGADDREADAASATAWAELAGGEVRERVFTGGHFFVQTERAAVCAAVAEELAA